jgi:hypothetical protein
MVIIFQLVPIDGIRETPKVSDHNDSDLENLSSLHLVQFGRYNVDRLDLPAEPEKMVQQYRLM